MKKSNGKRSRRLLVVIAALLAVVLATAPLTGCMEYMEEIYQQAENGGYDYYDNYGSDGGSGGYNGGGNNGGNNGGSSDSTDRGSDSSSRSNTGGNKDIDITVDDTPVTDNTVPEGSRLVELSYAQIAAKVAPCVVTVTSSYSYRGQDYVGQGSGFIITEDGYIVTNSHVIDDDNSVNCKIVVTIHDGEINAEDYDALVVGYDVPSDIAVLKINPKDELPVVSLGDSNALVKGDEVVAIGNPGGSQFAGSITTGVISGFDRILDDDPSSDSAMRYLQTDAAINPGNSGGPLVNIYGQVIGINTAKIVDEEYENLGFAIPMATAIPVIEQLIRKGSVVRPKIGVELVLVSEWAAEWQDIPVGARITGVSQASSLYGKVQEYDIIVECDGVAITTISTLQSIIESKNVGDTVKLKIYRPGKGYFEVTATLIS